MDWIEPASIDIPAALQDLHPLVAQRLLRNGLRTPAAALAFLDAHAYHPSPAIELPGLASIADRLEAAIHSHESICVWGDFDADGQTSTTILVQTLQELNAEVSFHIPVRETESHGVNLPHLQQVIEHGAKIILTCDTGINALAAADYARTHAVEMLITDHHDLPKSLPQAAGITDPKLLPDGHPLATLSGSGVAYKLAEELYGRFRRPDEVYRMVDLAALGLVADLARLTGDARYLVQLGLESLRNTQRLGLQVMMEMAELSTSALTEEHIGFVLAPRLNALGRLADANPAVELLTTSDRSRARVLAT
ncbi:MAG TPA: DHH family phosphoesterase, partial [Anaerolineales bacterium]|nr:DHH family phosphoesterase [Anaerolineales bacterium]